jgi:hypothetical protein
MQSKKILVACLSLLLVGLALSIANIPRTNAFHRAGSITVNLGGILFGAVDPLSPFGTVNAVQAGSTITATVVVQASSFASPAYQRNITIGFKGDWMTQYQNASTNTIPLTTNQVGSATITVTIPAVGAANSLAHSWSVAIWDGKANALNPAPCPTGGDPENANACVVVTPGPSLTFYTADQFAALQARVAANVSIGTVPNTFSLPAAAGQLAQANTELGLGDQSWTNGDYSGAKGHYQNALNDANTATSTFVNQGGGQTNANIVSAILASTGTVLFGIGGLLAGIGGFFYLRRKPKA